MTKRRECPHCGQTGRYTGEVRPGIGIGVQGEIRLGCPLGHRWWIKGRS